jgi:hypothetical protein
MVWQLPLLQDTPCLLLQHKPHSHKMPGNERPPFGCHPQENDLDRKALEGHKRILMVAAAAERNAKTPLKQMDMNAGLGFTSRAFFGSSIKNSSDHNLHTVAGYTGASHGPGPACKDSSINEATNTPATCPSPPPAAPAAPSSTAIAAARLSSWMHFNLQVQRKRKSRTPSAAALLKPSGGVVKRTAGNRSTAVLLQDGVMIDAPAPSALPSSSSAAAAASDKGTQALPLTCCCSNNACRLAVPTVLLQDCPSADGSVLDYILGPSGLAKHDVCYCIQSRGQDAWQHARSLPKSCWGLVRQYNKAQGLTKRR